jgi:hypothetical protein
MTYNKLPKYAAKARLGQTFTGLRATTFIFAPWQSVILTYNPVLRIYFSEKNHSNNDILDIVFFNG